MRVRGSEMGEKKEKCKARAKGERFHPISDPPHPHMPGSLSLACQ